MFVYFWDSGLEEFLSSYMGIILEFEFVVIIFIGWFGIFEGKIVCLYFNKFFIWFFCILRWGVSGLDYIFNF